MSDIPVLLEEELPSIDVEPGFSVSPIFDFGGVDVYAWQIVLFLLGIIALIVVPIVVYSIIHAKRTGEKFRFGTRDLVYGSICLAMSYALSFFGISLNLGGTITFASILPVTIYCYYFGFRKGAIICSAYMLLQLTQGPYIVSLWSMLLDYMIPYFSLCFSGLFAYNSKKHKNASGSKRFALISHYGYYIGMLIYIVIRYTSHILSGVIFWDLWYGPAPIGFVVGFSFAYNSFCLIDFAISIVASLALLSSRSFDRLMTDVTLNKRRRKATSSASAPDESQQSADGSVTSETDGLTHADTSAKNDK